MANTNRRIVRQRRVNKAPIFILLAVIFILIGIIALLMANFVSEDLNSSERENNLTKLELMNISAEQFRTESLGDAAQAVIARKKVLSSSGETPVTDYKTEHVKVETVVPESKPVDSNYFKDAIFIGDSISLGIKNSGVIPAKNMLVEKNVGLDKAVRDEPVYYVSGSKEKKSLFDALALQAPDAKKVYVLLGLNGLPGYDNDYHIQFYYQLVDRLKATYPDAVIYVQSLTPMTPGSEYHKRFTSQKIQEFNALIKKMAEEKGVYYLAVDEAVRDANGNLNQDYAAADGLHMVTSGHKAMLQYYKSHTVQPDGYTDKIVKEGE